MGLSREYIPTTEAVVEILTDKPGITLDTIAALTTSAKVQVFWHDSGNYFAGIFAGHLLPYTFVNEPNEPVVRQDDLLALYRHAEKKRYALIGRPVETVWEEDGLVHGDEHNQPHQSDELVDVVGVIDSYIDDFTDWQGERIKGFDTMAGEIDTAIRSKQDVLQSQSGTNQDEIARLDLERKKFQAHRTFWSVLRASCSHLQNPTEEHRGTLKDIKMQLADLVLMVSMDCSPSVYAALPSRELEGDEIVVLFNLMRNAINHGIGYQFNVSVKGDGAISIENTATKPPPEFAYGKPGEGGGLGYGLPIACWYAGKRGHAIIRTQQELPDGTYQIAHSVENIYEPDLP